MPACTALGVKSSISVAGRSGACPADFEAPDPHAARKQAISVVASVAARMNGGQDMRFVEWAARMRCRVTFSRNLTLSLSRTCRCYCKYCAFATHQAHLYSPEEVLELLDRAVSRHHVKELLVLTGEMPEVNPGVAERLRAYGHADFTSYV